MLELGGMSQGSGPIRPVDASKNSKVRAICFDFGLLTRAVDHDKNETIRETASAVVKTQPTMGSVAPDVSMVQNIANLLNVDLDGTSNMSSSKEDEFRDDLSGLAGDSLSRDDHIRQGKKAINIRDKNDDPSTVGYTSDIRAKYAAKLRSKLDGGLSGLESAKHERGEALKKGDAAGHFAARANAVSPSQEKWLALTGTGTLLTYVTKRSIKVALLPVPGNAHHDEEARRMEDFSKQMANQVTVDVMAKEGTDVVDILHFVSKEFRVPPMVTMVVSDRDDYLKAAKDDGMITCRIRPANARRGNITAHYNVPVMADVQEVVNEINGISFNALSNH